MIHTKKELVKAIKKVAKRFKFKNPYFQYMDLREYQRIISTDRFEGGKAKFLSYDIKYADAIGFLHSVEEIFINEVYNFIPEKDNPTIIDCGSNIGLSILYFKSKFPKAKIIGFEPDSNIFDLLTANINASGFSDVNIHNAAVWIENTELNFFSEGSLAGSTTINYIENNDRKYLVQAVDLKDYLRANDVDFLKIDIEGAENKLMPDIEQLISKIPFIFLEYHGMYNEPQQLGEILDLLKRAGFRYIIQPAIGGVRYPFHDNEKKGFENQLNIFCKRQ
ncbi:FkbM family methyltransferase [Spirosoma rigui]|uniref:FkbM family methyltransferase n=1 Tax=Spirosoma rigui TaxID=564064 RepID=UPI0009AF6D3C|nr:FkbM family methyltransferase [Spirosoma rigui]